MNPDRYERVQEVFLGARALQGLDRARHLDLACAGDAELRREVDSLLAADSPTAEGFLESPALGTGFRLGEGAHPDAAGDRPTGEAAGDAARAGPEEPMPERIGLYRLLQKLGEGGFGVVYAAEQEKPVQRRVALKIIKLGMDTRQVIARFEQERQALALMDHPNIAKVLDAGASETGRPYFVMELVQGEPITNYCDGQSLSIAERLDLFAQVCNAVQHAHTKGIIHRDIKPSNVLVSTQDGHPFAKVIDFGIAKATNARLTEKTVFTEHRQLIGTLEYMSPEQAEGSLDIDTRTDVYSLGVLLYELLTGSTPFESRSLRSAAYAEIQRIIREVEPPRPSTRLSNATATLAGIAAHRRTEPRKLGTMIRGELDWIVMKALEKDRQRRYETASGFALDIRRYLAGEPVVAAPPSAVYRARKFVRRHRVGVLAGGVVAAALLLATGISVWFGLRELAARQRESEQRSEAVRQQGIAEANAAAESKARRRAEGINAFVIKALQSSDPYAGGEQDTTIAQAMDNAIREIEGGAFKADPETEGGLRYTIGAILANNGRPAQAEPLYKRALEIYEEALGPDHPDVAANLNNLAMLYDNAGQYAQAEPLYKRALAIYEKARGPEHTDVATCLSNLGVLYDKQGKYAEAEPLLKRALAIVEKARGPDHESVATCLNNLAALYQVLGQLAQAEPILMRSLVIRERALGPDHPSVATGLNNLARLYQDQGQLAKAEPLFIQAMDIWKRALGPDHPDVATAMTNLAVLYTSLGQHTQAESLYGRALAIKERAYGPDHPDVATGLINLAELYRARGQYAEAEPLYKRSLAIREKALGPDHTDVAGSLYSLGEVYRAQGQYTRAEPLFARALAINVKALGPDNAVIASNLTFLARTHHALGKIAEARQGFDEAVAMLRRLSPDGSALLARVLWRSGAARLEDGDAAAAQPELEEAVAMAEKFLPPEHPHLKEYRESLGACREAIRPHPQEGS